MKNWGKILALFLLLTLLGSSFFSCRSAESNPPKDDAEDRQEEEDFPRTGKDNIAVCIDAGHGFGDVGCGPAYIGAYEYEITIRVAQLLRDKLEKEGITVILTHDGSTFPSAGEITKLADQHSISYKPENMIDNNVFSAYERVIWENVLDSGMSIDYCEDNPNRSFLRGFSNNLKKACLNAELTDTFTIFEDTYEDSFIVTKYTEVPSVLIEMGYSTNTNDAQKLCSEKWQNQFASLLCERICYAFGK